ncbi:MAG TPA: RidA family protein [Longimicrobiales bacterium]|nr:RidA family protein [Longimicrobiales bacterium]
MSERSWSPVTLGSGFKPPAGAYSPALRAGPFIYLSGQVPKDPATGALTEGDVQAQTHTVMQNCRRLLEAAGASLDDVVSVTAYIASMDDWQAFDDVYRTYFTEPRPTRTTVGVDLRGFLVEISVVAYRPE